MFFERDVWKEIISGKGGKKLEFVFERDVWKEK